jgi:hypothetical protein
MPRTRSEQLLLTTVAAPCAAPTLVFRLHPPSSLAAFPTTAGCRRTRDLALPEPADRPHATIISAELPDLGQGDAFAGLDFHGFVTPSLLDGYTHSYRLLSSTGAGIPVLILVDLTVFEPTYPPLSGLLLIAALARHIRLREIRPAWLIGLATAPTPKQELEARVAGCHHLLPLPITQDGRALLAELETCRPPLPPRADTTTLAKIMTIFQSTAQRVIEAARAVQAHTWTEEEVLLLLRWLTLYPAPSSLAKQSLNHPATHHRAEQLINVLGGPVLARQRLETIAAAWQQHYPLHSEILRNFLAGLERREIVQSIVSQGLYEDSRIYHCIKELPGRIGAYLRWEQTAAPNDRI